MFDDKRRGDVLEQDWHDAGAAAASHAKHDIGWWN